MDYPGESSVITGVFMGGEAGRRAESVTDVMIEARHRSDQRKGL